MRPMICEVSWRFGHKPLRGVEIGVWKGDHAAEILDNLNIQELVLVDPYAAYPDKDREVIPGRPLKKQTVDWEALHQSVVRRFEADKRVHVVRLPSSQAPFIAVGKYDFIYIDGNHKYEFVKQDIALWAQWLTSDGIIGGHDYYSLHRGLIAAVDEYAEENGFVVEHKDKDWWYVKQ